ncbi:MAG: NAD-dependent malic enzyme [Nitrospirota bacterium]|nr:NAD-dependent malic enzyme [Nitrospirota bacterium]
MAPVSTGSHIITIRVGFRNRPGFLGEVMEAIGDSGATVLGMDLVAVKDGHVTRDITVETEDAAHGDRVMERLGSLDYLRVVHVSDPTFLMHLGGKIEVTNKTPLKTREDLSRAYTPGVARICEAIHKNPEEVYTLTIKRNTVAVVTDGTAVLGLGDIGPAAALPVMEGKAMLFKEFAGVDAFPICLDTTDPDEVVRAVEMIAPVFGGINLEDISAPRCFEIEQRLKDRLDIPVFHDDQHGTAVVVLAALYNALKIVPKPINELKVVVSGIGAAGVACTKIMMLAGVEDFIGVDRTGIIYRGRTEGMNPLKEWYAENTNRDGLRGGLGDALVGADLFLGVSSAGLLEPWMLDRMASDPIVFALANPVPEIMPEQAMGRARIIATGRSDFPNQINNVLCFPGIFRGALDCRAREVNEAMKLAAARAIADVIPEDELSEDYIIPSTFNRQVAPAVAEAVVEAARLTGVARRDH